MSTSVGEALALRAVINVMRRRAAAVAKMGLVSVEGRARLVRSAGRRLPQRVKARQQGLQQQREKQEGGAGPKLDEPSRRAVRCEPHPATVRDPCHRRKRAGRGGDAPLRSRAMSEGRVLLIRHGESTWNAAGRWQGWGDPPLSERGRAQATALARRLAAENVVGLVASDLLRAAETARILGHALAVAPAFDSRLRERNLGAWAGLTEAQIRAAFPEELERLRARDPDLRPGGGESRGVFRARAAPALAAAAEAAQAGVIAVVTHLGVIRLLDPELRPENAGIVAVSPDRLRALAAGP